MKRDMETDLWFDTMKKETSTKHVKSDLYIYEQRPLQNM